MTTTQPAVAPGPSLTGGAAGSLPQANQAARQLLQAPQASVPAVPSLQGDMAIACGHANSWLRQLGPQMEQVLQSTLSFGPTFQGVYTNLQQLAQQVMDGSPQAGQQFEGGLSQLLTPIAAIQASVGALDAPLSSFLAQGSADQRALGADAETAQNALQALQSQYAGTNNQMERVSAELAQERLVTPERVLEDVATLGIAELVRELEDQQANLGGQLNALEQQLNAQQQAQGTLVNAMQAANVFSETLGSLQDAMAGFDNRWDQFAGSFNELKLSAGTSSAFFLSAALQALQANWNEVEAQANALLGA